MLREPARRENTLPRRDGTLVSRARGRERHSRAYIVVILYYSRRSVIYADGRRRVGRVRRGKPERTKQSDRLRLVFPSRRIVVASTRSRARPTRLTAAVAVIFGPLRGEPCPHFFPRLNDTSLRTL